MLPLLLLLSGAPPVDRAEIMAAAPDLAPAVLDRGLRAYRAAERKKLVKKPVLTIVDYRLASTKKRMVIIDMQKGRVIRTELVAHGKGSGANYAKKFSNEPGSLTSSLGVFRTKGTYHGKHGLSLKLEGLEPGFNDKAMSRAIVMHGADYVSRAFAKKHGRLGRSWGCPAVPKPVTAEIIAQLEGGSILVLDYPDPDWLRTSRYVARR